MFPATKCLYVIAPPHRKESHVEVACQTGISIASEWFTFIQGLPHAPATSFLSTNATADAIVRIYLRQLATVTDIPVGSERAVCHFCGLQAGRAGGAGRAASQLASCGVV